MAGYVLARFEFPGRIAALAHPRHDDGADAGDDRAGVHAIRGMAWPTHCWRSSSRHAYRVRPFLTRQYLGAASRARRGGRRSRRAGPGRPSSASNLPLAMPGLAIVGILAFNYHWNEFFRPLIMTISEQNFTLPLGLVTLTGEPRHREHLDGARRRGDLDDPSTRARLRLRSKSRGLTRGPDRRQPPLTDGRRTPDRPQTDCRRNQTGPLTDTSGRDRDRPQGPHGILLARPGPPEQRLK